MGWLLKYLGYGLLGLALRVAFPQWPVDWWVLTLAYGYLSQGFRPTLWLLLLLAFFYSAYSILPLWQWVVPGAFALLSWAWFQNFFSIHRTLQLVLLITHLWLVDFLFWNGMSLLQGGGLWLGGGWNYLSTLTVGMILLPALQWILQNLWHRLPKPRRPLAELSWLRLRERSSQSKKPFGWEKTF